jgi:hypothetical protein
MGLAYWSSCYKIDNNFSATPSESEEENNVEQPLANGNGFNKSLENNGGDALLSDQKITELS